MSIHREQLRPDLDDAAWARLDALVDDLATRGFNVTALDLARAIPARYVPLTPNGAPTRVLIERIHARLNHSHRPSA